LFKAAVEAPPAAGYIGGTGDGRQRGVVSMIAVVPPDPKRFKKNDLLTIVIREDSDAQVNGQASSKKQQDFDLALQQFIQASLSSSGLPELGTVGNSSKLPEIKFKYSNDRQNDAAQMRSDSFSARITATVVDVKPNNTMVIEAVKQITMDKEVQTFKLSGICRGEDIAVDNTVLSTQLANLNVSKETSGEVRDGTKRGWLNEFWDEVNPF
jgi:flagellar L-ring protein precursor FlgH